MPTRKTKAKPKTARAKSRAVHFDAEKYLAAALQALAKAPWAEFEPLVIAQSHKFDVTEVQHRYPDKHQLLAAMIDEISRRTADTVGQVDLRQPPRDRLFDVLMTRLDVLQPHRAAVSRLLHGIRHDPRLGLTLGMAQWQAMGKMLDLAGLADGVGIQLRISALTAIYGLTLSHWLRDHTPDQAKTMAFLDRLLRQANKAADALTRWQKLS